jgi:DNA-binding transcriptional MocR family regulator
MKMVKDICFVEESTTPPAVRGEQRDTIYGAMHRHFPHVVSWASPKGNAWLWVTLPPEIDARELLTWSRRQGVVFVPGSAVGSEHNTMCLHFSHLEPAEIEEGIECLGRLIAKYMHLASLANDSSPFCFIGP